MNHNIETTQRKQKSLRGKKVQCAEEIFMCGCQKNYLTFSALYLHVKNKHGVKLSVRREDVTRKQEYLNNKKYTTYYIQGVTHYKDQQNTKKQQQIKSIAFKNTVNAYRNHGQMSKSSTWPNFEMYIDEVADTINQDNSLPEDLVYYFNEFIVYYLPKHDTSFDSATFKQKGQELIQFWRWMKDHGHTQTDLRISEAYGNILKL